MITIIKKTVLDYRKEIKELEEKLKYNKSRIFKNAYYRKSRSCMTFSDALKESWEAAKDYRKQIRLQLEHLYLKIEKMYRVPESDEMQQKDLNDMIAALITDANRYNINYQLD